MESLGIFLPTYKRPQILQKVADNIVATTTGRFKIYFGVEADDKESFEAAKATGHTVVVNKYDPKFGYSNTIQSIYEKSKESILFHANDDFIFLPGWNEASLLFLEEHPEIMVLGAHDGMPTVSYSTISFIRREYIEKYSGVVDMPDRVFYPYRHNFQDTELTMTAKAREVWAKIESPCIKHNRTGGDETYKKNEITVPEDARTFESRRHLWEDNDLKGNIMPRRKMTAEEKKLVSERMKARWSEKKSESQNIESDELSFDQNIFEDLQAKLSLLHVKYPDMIEITQARDLIGDTLAKVSQIQGLLNS